MMKRIFSYIFILPTLAYGATGGGGSGGAGQDKDLSFIRNLLCKSVDWIFTFSLIIGIIFVLFAAFTYMTSSGNEEKVSQANRSLFYAAIGLLIAILANGVPAIIGDFVNVSGVSACP